MSSCLHDSKVEITEIMHDSKVVKTRFFHDSKDILPIFFHVFKVVEDFGNKETAAIITFPGLVNNKVD